MSGPAITRIGEPRSTTAQNIARLDQKNKAWLDEVVARMVTIQASKDFTVVSIYIEGGQVTMVRGNETWKSPGQMNHD